jgi:hypothetical protein
VKIKSAEAYTLVLRFIAQPPMYYWRRFNMTTMQMSAFVFERFDEDENSRARLGSQRSSFLVQVPVLVQQLQQLHRRASLAPRLPHAPSFTTLLTHFCSS